MDDQERERLIDELRVEVTLAYRGGDASRARIAWEQLRAAVNGRSPRQVERMEVAKGLR